MERRLDVLRIRVKLLFAHDTGLANLAHDRPLVANGFDDIAGTGLTLRADNGGTFRDAAQSFAEVACTANKRNLERMLVYVVLVVSRGQDLRFIDIVNADGLQDLFPEIAHERIRLPHETTIFEWLT